ncbi:MAG: hypothetical protein KC502_18010 [Myxococcales bacterium]|nr:hypothetical protein [Myxococcales bacterium]
MHALRPRILRFPGRVTRPFIGALVTCSLLLAISPQSATALVYGGHIGASKPVMDDGKGQDGLGLDLGGRVGVEIPMPFFDLEAETIVGVSSYALSGDAPTQTVRIGVGFRGGANFGAFFQGFAHLSYGRQFNAARGAPVGPIADIGVAVDVTLLPYIRLGIYGAYNHMIHNDKTRQGDGDGQWLSFGIQGAFVE